MGVFISRTGIDISMMAMNMECQNSCIRSAVCGPDITRSRLLCGPLDMADTTAQWSKEEAYAGQRACS